MIYEIKSLIIIQVLSFIFSQDVLISNTNGIIKGFFRSLNSTHILLSDMTDNNITYDTINKKAEYFIGTSPDSSCEGELSLLILRYNKYCFVYRSGSQIITSEVFESRIILKYNEITLTEMVSFIQYNDDIICYSYIANNYNQIFASCINIHQGILLTFDTFPSQ